jgi:hypothetical protein
MRLNPNSRRQSEYDRQRTGPNPVRSNTGILLVLGAIVLALALFYLAYMPAGAPNSGSTSTSTAPAADNSVKSTPAPGVAPDGTGNR